MLGLIDSGNVSSEGLEASTSSLMEPWVAMPNVQDHLIQTEATKKRGR